MLRGLLLLAFLLGVLAVHPCVANSAEHAHARGAVPVAASGAHHAHHGSVAPSAGPVASAGAQVRPLAAPCMGGACALGAREYAGQVPAPAPDTVAQAQLNPVPLGSAAPGAAPGRLHSGRSPGALPHHGPDAARFSVLRT